jgi:hypothetical protein
MAKLMAGLIYPARRDAINSRERKRTRASFPEDNLAVSSDMPCKLLIRIENFLVGPLVKKFEMEVDRADQ